MLDWDPELLLGLIGWLPDDGAFAASVRGGKEHYGWGKNRHMMADLWDLLSAYAMAGSKKKAPRQPRPAGRGKRRTWRTLIEAMKKEHPATGEEADGG